MQIFKDLEQNIGLFEKKLPIQKSFDLVGRRLIIAGKPAYYLLVDGLSKDDVLLRLFQHIQGQQGIEDMETLESFLQNQIGYIETTLERDVDLMMKAILSGQTLLLIDGFDQAILLDMRTYPVRSPQEPDLEKVTRGSRDGLVETIVFNTALVRRRVRDPTLVYEMKEVGSKSCTDVVIGYIDGLADPHLVAHLREALDNIHVDALLMGEKTLEELLIKKRWYNPFPQAKFTERPDVVAAHLLEGHVVLMVDNSPSAMLFPATLFHFTQHSEDYYQNPLVGTYIRWIRFFAILISLLFTPLWLLLAQNPDFVPSILQFMIPTESAAIPLFVQLLLVELGLEILRMASIHTPSSLTTAMGIIGGLILGQYAIEVNLLIPDTVLYMAIAGLATYAVPSVEFGMAIRIYRIFILLLTGLFDVWGFAIGFILFLLVLVTTRSFSGLRYTWPLLPFDGRALSNVLIRKPIIEVKRHEKENRRKPVK